MIYGVIMAGGKGERFWPLSREAHPKQLLAITSERTMLQETIDRVVDFIPLPRIKIVTGQSLRDKILSTIDYLGEDNLITEPFGKSTCMTIGLAAAHLYREDREAIMVVLSCDHDIRPEEALIELLKVGCRVASDQDYLITIGITPTRAETGYGYIEQAERYDRFGGVSIHKINKFTEKPDRIVAQQYYYDRKHLWNSGMFIWSAKAILDAIHKFQPEMAKLLDDYSEAIGTDKELDARVHCYQHCQKISIDVAILENAENVLVIKGDLMWDDIGSWRALERLNIMNSDNNVLHGNVEALDTYETTIYNDSDGIITTLGVSDLIIVRSGDIVMVTHKTRSDDISKLLEKLREDERREKYT
ncbi:MAG: mannose-1-phosphate guanylyltransferase [candidate division Zixibacteria bacterium]|nr:mannose-1-phosphate guanylyltransferase [candidate division Zixibacteria bacterium]MBU1470573.1 mannose-1-phosphate guanylyltransferase [candidate division Zixibacteria bacterium]MBU2624453.1 mannose-1-phosphate guanylyltransferase [candidate division Zixibacteria bacterium]